MARQASKPTAVARTHARTVSEETSKQRPAHGSEGEHGGHWRDVGGALAGGCQVSQQNHGDGEDAAATDALEGAEDDEHLQGI